MAKFLTPSKDMTVGENRFSNLLKRYLDDDYLVWFDIPTNSNVQRFPDFLIFNPNYGLWCIEIKDWAWGNYTSIKGEKVFIKHNDVETSHTSPILQARQCILEIINKLKQDKQLLSKKSVGNLVIPWTYGAVMTRWELDKLGTLPEDHVSAILGTFPPNLTFFKEELELLDQKNFIKKLHGMQRYCFDKLTKAQAARVRAHIFPECIIEQKSLFEDDRSMEPQDIITIMDNTQETFARSLGNGHRVIHGVAGSGKTVLLLHRARTLAAQNPDKEILVTCYNVVLAKCLQQQLDVENITVTHFHGWCKAMCEQFDLTVADGGWQNIFQRQADAACHAVADGSIPRGLYYAVLIDEGHDFAPEWLTTMSQLPDSEEEQLMLLYDDAQSIYDNRGGLDFTLSSVGIKARGRTIILRTNYRNSFEILNTAERFLRQFMDTRELEDDDDIPLLSMTSGGKQTDEYPIFQQCGNFAEEYETIINQVVTWKNDGVRLGDIAILFKTIAFAKELKKELIDSDISVNSIITSNDKKKYQPQSDSLTLCSMASSKGSEFSHVILAGLGACRDNDDDKGSEARLIYVGMTRAQNALFMTASKNNRFTQVLDNKGFVVR